MHNPQHYAFALVVAALHCCMLPQKGQGMHAPHLHNRLATKALLALAVGMGDGWPVPHVAWMWCNLLADMECDMAQQVVQQRLAHHSNWIPCGLVPKAWLASLAMGMGHGCPAPHVAWVKCNLLQGYLYALAPVLADMAGYMAGYMAQQVVQQRLAHHSN